MAACWNISKKNSFIDITEEEYRKRLNKAPPPSFEAFQLLILSIDNENMKFIPIMLNTNNLRGEIKEYTFTKKALFNMIIDKITTDLFFDSTSYEQSHFLSKSAVLQKNLSESKDDNEGSVKRHSDNYAPNEGSLAYMEFHQD